MRVPNRDLGRFAKGLEDHLILSFLLYLFFDEPLKL